MPAIPAIPTIPTRPEPEEIRREHVERALDYIIRHEMRAETAEGVYYLKRREGNPRKYAPDGWATRHRDPSRGDMRKWVCMKETVRVAYLYLCGEPPGSDFSDEKLIKVDEFSPMWHRGQSILENLGFLCEDRRP